VVESHNVAKTMEVVANISGNKATLDEGLRMISAPVSTGATALIETLRSLDTEGIHPLDVGLKRPSLDDVFLSLTGHAAEEKKPEETEVRGRGKKAKK
jgi:ABC-2 type transport system ATP-binding protein